MNGLYSNDEWAGMLTIERGGVGVEDGVGIEEAMAFLPCTHTLSFLGM